MLGQSQIALTELPPASRAWNPVQPGLFGPFSGQLQSTKEAELKREELVDSFRHSTSSTAGLEWKGLSGHVLAFKPRQLGRTPQPRSRELAWRRAHEPELRALAGHWVVVEGDQIIGHGENAAEVVAEARARGFKVPYVFFVEPVRAKTFKLGL